MAQLDYKRAKSIIDSLPPQPVKVSTFKSILLNVRFDDDLVEETIKSIQEVFTNPLDRASSCYDLAGNILPTSERDWIAHLVELADPLVDDSAWPRPSPRLKARRAKAWVKLVDHPDQFDYVERAIASVGFFRDRLKFLDVLAGRAMEWSQEQRRNLLQRIWKLATIKRLENVEALTAFAVPILESLAESKVEMFWKFYGIVEWAYQELPRLNMGQDSR